MSELEKQVGEDMAKAINLLPADKLPYFMGYARGVADMAEKKQATEAEKRPA